MATKGVFTPVLAKHSKSFNLIDTLAVGDDASRSQSTHCPGFRVGDRNARTFSLRQANCQLCRTGSDGRVQRRSSSTRSHQQARQCAAAVSTGGSRAGDMRSQAESRGKFFHLAMRRGRKIAKVAMARKLAVHLYWMWRQGSRAETMARCKSSVRRESPEIAMVCSKSPT